MAERRLVAERTPRWLWPLVGGVAVLACGMLLGGVVVSVLAARRFASLPSVPPLSSSVTVVRPTANVLAKVRDLKRLESVSFHMERVIDLTEKQSQLFGLVETEDAILLVAAADVRAGVDLAKLGPADVTVDIERRTARVALPPAEILGVRARRRENLRSHEEDRRSRAAARKPRNTRAAGGRTNARRSRARSRHSRTRRGQCDAQRRRARALARLRTRQRDRSAVDSRFAHAAAVSTAAVSAAAVSAAAAAARFKRRPHPLLPRARRRRRPLPRTVSVMDGLRFTTSGSERLDQHPALRAALSVDADRPVLG